MKLNKLFFVVFCVLPIFSLAAEQHIEINSDSWLEPGRRSLSFVPVLTHDGNTLFIYSDVPLANLQIQIKDAFANVIYIDDVSIAAGQKYSFVLEGAFPSNYMIELSCAKKLLWGNFEIDN